MINLQGCRFGRLVVLRRVPGGSWMCKCDCGKVAFVITGNLKRGNSRSCGCAWKQVITTHGLANTTEYKVWKAMHHRCRSNRRDLRAVYKDRGIKVCKEWSDFVVFLTDMGTRPSPKHQLDRIDTYRGYSKANCRWVTQKVNLNNKRTCLYIEFNGKRQTIAMWAEELGFNYRTLHNRIKRGWPIERALTLTTQKET